MAKILVVDDSEIALEWARSNLTERGFEVIVYGESLGIQVFVRKNEPDLLLLDVNMPALNGDMVCKLLKKNPKTANVIVALYSAKGESELRQIVIECGADGFVQKSEDIDLVVAQIQGLLLKHKVPTT